MSKPNNHAEARQMIADLEAFYEKEAAESQREADYHAGQRGSESAAAEGGYQQDANVAKNAAQCMRDALAYLNRR